MYKLNDIHNSDGKGNFEKMVISEAERVKPIIKEQFLREYILGTGDTYEIFNIYCKTFGVDRMLETRMIIIKPAQQNEDEDIFFLKNTTFSAKILYCCTSNRFFQYSVIRCL